MKYSKDIEVLNCTEAHKDIINNIKNNMDEIKELDHLADFFEAFGNKKRIRILYALFNSELCVCDIVELLKIDIDDAKYQLMKLSNSGIIKHRDEGDIRYYSLKNSYINDILVKGFINISSN